MTSSLQSSFEDGIPVIDISQFPTEIEGDRLQYHPEVVKLAKACEEWETFTIVNHGVPQDLLQKVLSVTQDLLSMPMELKDTVTTSNSAKSYSRAPIVPIPIESFCFVNMPNPDSDLAQRITKLILVSLGLDAETLYHSDFENCTAWLRIYGYSSHGKSIGEEALIAHTDRGCLVILNNDEEEGLQVRSKEGKWINVKPSPDALIAWSNGRYMCAVHRVICKGRQNRLSVPFVFTFAADTQISALEVLVNEDDPRRYKPFIFCDLQCEELRKEFEEL